MVKQLSEIEKLYCDRHEERLVENYRGELKRARRVFKGHKQFYRFFVKGDFISENRLKLKNKTNVITSFIGSGKKKNVVVLEKKECVVIRREIFKKNAF